MTAYCELGPCTNLARPGRRTCTTHRDVRAITPSPAGPDLEEVELVVREDLDASGLPRAEQQLVAARLAERDVPAPEIARRIGVHPRTIARWNAA